MQHRCDMEATITNWVQAIASVLTMVAAIAALIIASKAPRLAASRIFKGVRTLRKPAIMALSAVAIASSASATDLSCKPDDPKASVVLLTLNEGLGTATVSESYMTKRGGPWTGVANFAPDVVTFNNPKGFFKNL